GFIRPASTFLDIQLSNSRVSNFTPDFSDKVRLKSSKPSSKSCKILLVCNYLSCYNDKKHILQNLYGAFAIYILETADYL
uniref:hypothetical protein n=1 Tax=Roseburia inulinivorans TaxID=360807 RepID=UPI00266BEF0D